jgi:hypothetical protein
MPPVPFKLLGASDCAAIAAHAAAASAAWREAWIGANAGGAPSATSGPAADAPPLDDCLAYATGGARLYLAHAAAARSAVVDALSGGRSDRVPEAGSIAGGVIDDALDALAGAIAGGAVARAPEQPPATTWAKGSGAAWLELSIGRATLGWIAEAPLVRDWLAAAGRVPRAAPRVPLTSPQHGLGRERIEVRVWLGRTELDLGTLHSLATGDVIVLDSRIDEPLGVSVGGRDVAPRAHLGESGGRKAVRLALTAGNH